MITKYDSQPLAKQIRASEKTRRPVEASLTTDVRVIARITDGIYRQPSSALRELISNAYDADATEVNMLTDAPRFSQISVRDNGIGLSPETIEYLVRHIGGSAKHSREGQRLKITSRDNENLSPGGRQLIGKLGIGLFSVAQFTRHFLVITKTKGDRFRTIADITLGAISGKQKLRKKKGRQEIETGSAKIWREFAADTDSQGTEIKLLELLPRTRAELASDDLWVKIQTDKEDDGIIINPPSWHIGRMKPNQSELLEIQPRLPWNDDDNPPDRFTKLIQAIRRAAQSGTESVDLDMLFDNYLRTLWTLALSAPLKYVEEHPFDIDAESEIKFYELGNTLRGQAKELHLSNGQNPRKELKLKSPNGPMGKAPFDIILDGVQLFRPIIFKDLPKTKHAVTSPLVFIGHDYQKFEKKPVQLSGGPLKFEAYLFWAPRIIPNQHQGVLIRVGNASGALFDKTFMGYQVSEQTRTRQITAEIYVLEGIEDAINIDRESYNNAHPHYQYLVKWLHSALRQLANRHKEVGKQIRALRLEKQANSTREKIDENVIASLKKRGNEDVPDVILLESAKQSEIHNLRSQGTIALRKEIVVPKSTARRTTENEKVQLKLAEKKAIAIAQILHGWGLLKDLTYEDQEKLIRDILEIVLLEN